MAADGASREEIARVGQFHATTVVHLLGYRSFDLAVVEVAAAARIALVTYGVWRHAGALVAFNDARSQADLARLVSRGVAATRDDATAVLLDVA